MPKGAISSQASKSKELGKRACSIGERRSSRGQSARTDEDVAKFFYCEVSSPCCRDFSFAGTYSAKQPVASCKGA